MSLSERMGEGSRNKLSDKCVDCERTRLLSVPRLSGSSDSQCVSGVDKDTERTNHKSQ